jgi:hypothetical protein
MGLACVPLQTDAGLPPYSRSVIPILQKARHGPDQHPDSPPERRPQGHRRDRCRRGRALAPVGAEMRDLIRRDEARASREAFDRLKAAPNRAFAAAEDGYRSLTTTEVIIRNRT